MEDIMNSSPEDLLAIIIAKLPIKNFTICKLVCKQWKSIVESPYFRDLFLSQHQNSHSSSWSLMSLKNNVVMAHYGCDTWGLQRSLSSYISSFITAKFESQRDKYRVWNYTDVGLILISEATIRKRDRSLYVANPVTQECVEIPSHAHIKGGESRPLGIVTRTEHNVLLDYKVVLVDYDGSSKTKLSLLIYSSETGLWSLSTFHLPVSLFRYFSYYSISLKGNIHWLASNNDLENVVVSMDVYATGIGSNQCRVTTFPDSGKHFRFRRFYSISQGFIMYMNIVSITQEDGSVDDKLCVWRLKNWEWQLISEMPFLNPDCDYSPLTIDPFDAETVYFWSKKQQSLVSINLRNGKFVLHSELERRSNGRILSSPGCRKIVECRKDSFFLLFALPQWLHRIPRR